MSHTPDTRQAAASPLNAQSPIVIVRIDCLESFIEQMADDAPRIRHNEVCCSTPPATPSRQDSLALTRVIAGYILEDDDGPRLVELRYPCGLDGSEREQAVAAYVLSVQAAASIKAAVLDTGLRWRVGRLTLDPSPLLEPGVLDCYTVRTVNGGDRQWRAVSPMHAREQHVEAFAGAPGEEILAVIYADPALTGATLCS